MHDILTNYIMCVCRDSIGAQLQLALAKADSEQLARSIAEEQLSDVEKEKTMLELELKEAMTRHKAENSKKEITISTVRYTYMCIDVKDQVQLIMKIGLIV